MYAYIQHGTQPGPFQTENVAVRRVDASGAWRGRFRSVFEIRRPGRGWRRVFRDPIAPAWVGSSKAPAHYILIDGERVNVLIRA